MKISRCLITALLRSGFFALATTPLPARASGATFQMRVPILGVPVSTASSASSLTQAFHFYPLDPGGSYVTESGGQRHALYVITVPSWATRMVVTARGAAGGYTDGSSGWLGGSGAKVQATLPIPTGTTTATITVGGVGWRESWLAGQAPGGAGGGLTSVDIGGEVAFAGSGGGAGTPESTIAPSAPGGDGGYPNGGSISDYSDNYVLLNGLGGVTTATVSRPNIGPGIGGIADPGCYAAGNTGSGHYGGAAIDSSGGCYGSGGGGSGYYGGGGGALGNNVAGGGGGGGSSYVSANATAVTESLTNNSSAITSEQGSSGLITLTWEP